MFNVDLYPRGNFIATPKLSAYYVFESCLTDWWDNVQRQQRIQRERLVDEFSKALTSFQNAQRQEKVKEKQSTVRANRPPSASYVSCCCCCVTLTVYNSKNNTQCSVHSTVITTELLWVFTHLFTHLFDHWQLQRRVMVFFVRCVWITYLLTYLITGASDECRTAPSGCRPSD